MADTTFVVSVPHETVNDQSVRILSWKAASGALVEKDQLICEVETSKVVLEIHAPGAGVIVYQAAVDDEVPVGSVLCRIVPESEAAGWAQPAAAAPVATDGSQRPARFTPLAVKVAAEHGVSLDVFPSGMLVRRDDVLRKAGKLAPAAKKATPVAAPTNVPAAGVPLEWSDLPRRKIVESRMLGGGRANCIQSSVTTAYRALGFTTRVEQLGLGGIGALALVIYEVSRLLHKYPVFNGLCDGSRMGLYGEVNVGWAVDGGTGLIVPVILHADQLSFREIAAVMQTHIEGYIENTLAPADLMGGTFTVSDLTAEGIAFLDPLISQGQSAILGIGRDANRVGGELFYLTLAFDHQLAEGRKAAQFLRDLRERLEVHGADAIGAPGGPHCMKCRRDVSALEARNAVLIRAEAPAGLICSICLAGY